jgi:ubiquinol-cytochrome c reductase core subunit 2
MDRLHQVAFRNGLGNPLFASAEAAGALNRAQLQEWAKVHFNPASMVVVGRGVDQAELKALVAEHANPYPKATRPSAAPAFHGGQEARLEAGPQSESCVALAYPGPSAGSADFAAAQVLRALLDGTKHSPWGSAAGVTGLLAGAAASHATSTAFLAAYSDAGLLGFHVHAASGAAGEVRGVLSKSIAALKTASAAAAITPEALARAKKGAIVQAEQSKSRADRLLELASAAFAATPAPSNAAFAAAVERVTAADVARVATAALKHKPSMVSSGNLLVLPHLDQL